jgi:voltage-gated potassium channel
MKNYRKRCFEILSIARKGDIASNLFDISIMSLIVANVIFCTLGTVNSFAAKHTAFLFYFELISVIIFSIEYVLRICSAVEEEKYSKTFKGRIKFIFSPMAFIDLLAILPFYITFGGINLIGLRALRLFRILRLVKIGRYYSSLSIIKNVFINKISDVVASFHNS